MKTIKNKIILTFFSIFLSFTFILSGCSLNKTTHNVRLGSIFIDPTNSSYSAKLDFVEIVEMNNNETVKNDFWIQHDHKNTYQNSWGIMMFNQKYEFNTSSINLFIHLDFYRGSSLCCYYAPTIKMYFKKEPNKTYSKIYFIDNNGNESNKFTLNSYNAIGTNLTITIISD